MKDRVEHHYNALLGEAGLPTDTLARASRFLWADGSKRLSKLPLSPDEMIEAGKAVTRAPDNPSFSVETAPIAPLPEGIRQKLRGLFDEGGPDAEAALYVLHQDLRIRAFNRALAECE